MTRYFLYWPSFITQNRGTFFLFFFSESLCKGYLPSWGSPKMFESNTSLFDPQHGRIYIGKFRRRYYRDGHIKCVPSGHFSGFFFDRIERNKKRLCV